MIFQTCCVSACVVGWEVWWSWLCCVNVIVTKPSYLMIWQPIKKDLSCLGERGGSGSLWADLCLIWKSWKENKGGRNHVFFFFMGPAKREGKQLKVAEKGKHCYCRTCCCIWHLVTVETRDHSDRSWRWGFKHISRQWKRSELPLRSAVCVCVSFSIHQYLKCTCCCDLLILLAI